MVMLYTQAMASNIYVYIFLSNKIVPYYKLLIRSMNKYLFCIFLK